MNAQGMFILYRRRIAGLRSSDLNDHDFVNCLEAVINVFEKIMSPDQQTQSLRKDGQSAFV